MSQDDTRRSDNPPSSEPAAGERAIKVTDRRMFTPDGQLREEYRELADAAPPEARARASESAPAPGGTDPRSAQRPDARRGGPEQERRPSQARPQARPERQAPRQGVGGRLRDMLGGGRGADAEPSQPPPATAEAPAPELDDEPQAAFQDLVALLAQSASVYLQQAAQLQVSRRAEAIEMARLHIELLRVLQVKTQGNLEPGEQALLDDALYQLRMAFVEYG